MHDQNRHNTSYHNTIPGDPYIQYHYRPPPYEHIYDKYHPYMQYIPPPPLGGLGMELSQRYKSPPKNELQQ